ncbi:MAG: pyrroline-5-carboxylate reductase, partial [Balneolales bacterium]
IEQYFGKDIPVVRAMPNTPSQVGAGMTALTAGEFAQESHFQLSEDIFGSVGRTLRIDEKHFDAVTALSASGPAFIYVVIEALAEGGVKSGLPRDVAIELAAQMTLGAAKMVIDTGQHPAILKDHVTTPAGCTIDGLLKLEEGGLRVTLIKAVDEAAKRAKALVND